MKFRHEILSTRYLHFFWLQTEIEKHKFYLYAKNVSTYFTNPSQERKRNPSDTSDILEKRGFTLL